MGQGSSRSERLTKEDVSFLKANTRYDEETIQVGKLSLPICQKTICIARNWNWPARISVVHVVDCMVVPFMNLMTPL